MANAGYLSPQVLESVASQIGAQLPLTQKLMAPGAGPMIGESLEVVVLPLDRLREGNGPLAERVVANGQWHHQVYVRGAATDFARSRALLAAPGAEHRVLEVVDSKLPEALRRTIEWTDEHAPEDARARLLEAPSYLLTALWLAESGGDHVVISSMADRISNLEINTLVPAEVFLERLAENEPVKGLGLPRRSAAATSA